MFACSPGDLIDVLQLCDGNEDCDGGDDETTALCESESVYYMVVGHHYHLYLSLIVQINVFCLTMEGVRTPEIVKHLNLMSTVGVVLMALVIVILKQMIVLVRYK